MIEKCQFLTFKVNFLCQKLSESFSFFFSLKNINLGAHFLLLSFFGNFNFWSTLFTKIMLIFWLIDLGRMLIWQKFFFMKKCYFSNNSPPIWCANCRKNLKCYLIKSLCIISSSLQKLGHYFVTNFGSWSNWNWNVVSKDITIQNYIWKKKSR